MASTNKTTNYLLSQFVASDKPSWLSDYNGDMLKIDTAIKQNADDIDAVEVSISSLSSDVASNTSSINTLNTNVGTNTNDITDLKAQDIIIKNDITNITTRVANIETANTTTELIVVNNYIRYKKCGNLVCLYLSTPGNSGMTTTNSEYQLGTIPASIAPSGDWVYGMVGFGAYNTKNHANIIVKTDGAVVVKTGDTSVDISSIRGNLTYLIG